MGPHRPSPTPSSVRETSRSENSTTPAPQKAKPKPRPRAKRTEAQPNAESVPSPLTTETGPNDTVASGHIGAAEPDLTGRGVGTHAGAFSTQIVPTAVDEPTLEQNMPQRSRRGRPRKRLQPNGDDNGESAPRKKRARKGKGPEELADTADEANSMSPSHTQDAQHATSPAPTTPPPTKDTASIPETAAKRGRKKQTDLPPRPTPVRQSARLKNARGA